MKNLFSMKIINLAKNLTKPLYAVGGVVRDFLIDESFSNDIDLASPVCVQEVMACATSLGIETVAYYQRTGTAVLFDGEKKYEFTSFRKDVYNTGGKHIPDVTIPTDDIIHDALRRDFKCNAVYYDIKNGKFCDPINGIIDIKNKVLSTVKEAKQVFSHDGLRLLRLARLSAELNFSPDSKTILGAYENRRNIEDISAERILLELNKILYSDTRHKFSDKMGHYNGLKILDKIGVLEIILPEICLGKGVMQRADYHKYDVFEHTLKSVLYAEKEIRLAALLHDVGKPECFINDGNFFMHAKRGEGIAIKILKRLKASNEQISTVAFLVRNHMLQVEEMREEKLRKFIADNFDKIDQLISLKEADYRALKDEPVPEYFLQRLKLIREQMLFDGTPIVIKQLKITAKELIEMGLTGREISQTLNDLRYLCISNPSNNNKEKLIKITQKRLREVKND